MGKILLKELAYVIKIGIKPEERKQAQNILIDLELTINMERAVETENITNTVDYNRIQETIKEFLANKEYLLLEKLSYDIATLVLNSFQKIKIVECTCWKPSAVKNAKNVGVKIVKERA